MRKQILRDDLFNKYLCCGGMLPCSGRCGERRCPRLCLATEACCCFANSVLVSRFLIQDELAVQNTKTDNCVIATMVFLQQLACVCSIVAACTDNPGIDAASDVINVLADLTYCAVCACLQTQHRVELDVRDGVRAPLNPDGAAARRRSTLTEPPAVLGHMDKGRVAAA